MNRPNWTDLANQNAQTRAERSGYQTPTQRVAASGPPTVFPRRQADPAKNAETFWTQYQPANQATILTDEMKDTLVFNKINFILTSIELRPGAKFGPAWFCRLEFDGQPYTAIFSDNTTRQDRYGMLSEFVRRNGPMLVGMESYDTNYPNPGYDLCQPYPTDVATDAIDTGADIPF